MPYFYPLLGITAWVIVTAFSSEALVAHENSKQAENVKSIIARAKQEVSVVKISTPSTVEAPTQETAVKAVNETTLIKPSTVKTSPVQKPLPRYRGEDDDD